VEGADLRKQDRIIIWPTYFDSTKTREGGRRIEKSLAVSSPRILELKEAAEKLGLECEVVANASYPKTPLLKTGVLLVGKGEPKEQVIKKIARQLLRIRGAATR